jgi:phage tail sheath gpL-like
MGDDQYHTIACGLALKTEVDKIVAELESRWLPPRQIEGHLFIASNDSQADNTTVGNSYNTLNMSLVGYEESAFCRLPWEIAARAAAISAKRVQADPSLATLNADMGATYSAAPRGTRYSWSERNTLLSDGVSTIRAASDGRMLLEKLITTYQTNAQGLPDKAFQSEAHVRLLAAIRYSFRAWMLSKLSGNGVAAKLADNGNQVSGQQIVTPDSATAEALSWFLAMQGMGWVENYAQFKAELIVERNAVDRDRLDFYMSPDLINALLVTAARTAFLR